MKKSTKRDKKTPKKNVIKKLHIKKTLTKKIEKYLWKKLPKKSKNSIWKKSKQKKYLTEKNEKKIIEMETMKKKYHSMKSISRV